ncbi:hypothetical protein NEOLEDRAFT_1183960 [Neolentinus lepideus HHB14362 ss-1]|uniref:Uncharacterized protein n=1 Tax=Neolentinus lepideus HHB14362 ss-1 TaxID=1314782 RepID=A0A165MUA9_9AGAM|nr:hypothetical protein NEOLEDRAFT_1183960 [Neolentinus lepideus HHB14362 ss-1]
MPACPPGADRFQQLQTFVLQVYYLSGGTSLCFGHPAARARARTPLSPPVSSSLLPDFSTQNAKAFCILSIVSTTPNYRKEPRPGPCKPAAPSFLFQLFFAVPPIPVHLHLETEKTNAFVVSRCMWALPPQIKLRKVSPLHCMVP